MVLYGKVRRITEPLSRNGKYGKQNGFRIVSSIVRGAGSVKVGNLLSSLRNPVLWYSIPYGTRALSMF